MIIWGIGIFFIVAGIVMWPFGHMCLIVGGIICIAKFFTQYKSVEGYQWTMTFNNSSLVKEICDYIDTNHVHKVEVKEEYITMDDYTINFNSRGISKLTLQNCELLARTIKNKIKYGEIYDLEPITKIIPGCGFGHDRPIGMTQTHNGNFVFDYGNDGPSTRTIGYSLSVVLKKEKPKKTSTRSEWK